MPGRSKMKLYRLETIWGAFLLRFSMGLLFFVAGVNKFYGDQAAGLGAGLRGEFEKTWLPGVMVEPYGTILPYAEVFLGATLILGLFRMPSLILGSLLMVSLAFGILVKGEGGVAANNFMYIGFFAAALLTTRWDRLALDTLIFHQREPGTFVE